jgi:VanZ family protein
MAKLEWMPLLLGKWANENPTFRNFPAFAALAGVFFLTVAAWSGAGRAALAFYSAVAASVLAVLLELAQLLLPARFFDPDDMAWSMAGALTGAALAWLMGAFFKAIRNSKTDRR